LRDLIVNNPNGECVKRVSNTQLYSIEKINLRFSNRLRSFAFDGPSINLLTRLKSLRLDCKNSIFIIYETRLNILLKQFQLRLFKIFKKYKITEYN
jgi:hypothetical protein